MPKRRRILIASAIAALPLYLLSTGPIAWATNGAFHRRFLPEEANLVYLPLKPLMRVEWINQAFFYYTAVIWGGWPAGYTTL